MKMIPLTKGQFALVDAEDFAWLNQWKWHTNKDRDTFYVVRSIIKNGKHIKIYMHREIMKAPDDKLVDHMNANGLDNRKQNLRLCSPLQNQANTKIRKDNKSGYKGVYWNKKFEKWVSQIKVNGKHISLGCFNTPKEAALAYTLAASKYFGEFAYK